jgi:diguanylate cyclase (GGDEF)-like protein
VLQAKIRSMQRIVAMRRQLMERSEQLILAVEAVTRLSELDELTGVFNRRGLDRKLGEEWGRAMRTGNPLTIMLLDIDNFKLFNDEHGHLAGDQCLRNVSDCLRLHVRRPADAVARFGGEEFCVVLPETPSEGSWTIAELLRTAISRTPTGTGDGAAFVTVSLGVVTLVPTEHMQIDDALACADRALYQSKAEGRNTVRYAPAQLVPVANRA